MASGYALPQNGNHKHSRAHQSFPSLNGLQFQQVSPDLQHDHDHSDQNGLVSAGYNHIHSQRLPMKGRIRGESNLARPSDNGVVHTHSHKDSRSVIPEILTALAIPLQHILASAAYSGSVESSHIFPPFSGYAQPDPVLSGTASIPVVEGLQTTALVETCILTSGTLLLVGVLAQIRSSERALDRRKRSDPDLQAHSHGLMSAQAASKMAKSMLSVALPLYAATQLGGTRVGLLILAGMASNLTTTAFHSATVSQRFLSSLGLCTVLLLCFTADFTGLTLYAPWSSLVSGYAALSVSLFALPTPLPSVASATSTWNGQGRPVSIGATSNLVSSAADSVNTLATGLIMTMVTIGVSTLTGSGPSFSIPAIVCYAICIAIGAGLFLLGRPAAPQSSQKAGLALGCLFTASSSFLFSPHVWPGSVVNGGLSALAFVGAMYDSPLSSSKSNDHDDHAHTGHSHSKHHHHHIPSNVSFFTAFLLSRVEIGSLVYDILCEKDSRRIAYFTCLNFAFMLVQAFYGYVSGSLGLLSDTVHMFFDCLALIVGLGASVASKWPTSPEKPYGWGKLNVLAGFGNGIFLMLVSVEFVWEAIEGMMEGTELRHVQELLVVSTLGLLVNMVGLLAFGHAHAGHDHGHGGHSHSHDNHNHGHDHGHAPTHKHAHDHSHSHGGHEHSHSHSEHQHAHHSHSHSHANSNANIHSHSHSHANGSLYADHQPTLHDHAHSGHDNENMHGIYLHVAADAGGSLAVIISTALNLWRPWYVWDPLATIVIALLIFMAAVPLVQISAKKLLLVIPDNLEYGLKNALQEVVTIRGVTGYAVPRFWVEEKEVDAHAHHGHDHGHDHGESKKEGKIMGVIHVFASRAASTEDVRERVVQFFVDRDMEVVVQVEREGEGRCWCGGGVVSPGLKTS